jgi:hypothetical protein
MSFARRDLMSGQGSDAPAGLVLNAGFDGAVLAGIRINPLYSAGAFAGVTKYGVYVATTENNYFAGKVGIGNKNGGNFVRLRNLNAGGLTGPTGGKNGWRLPAF